MSKSYGNVIPIFASPAEQKKLIMRIVTDSRPPEEPKDPESDNLFKLFEHFGASEDVAAVRERYTKGGIGYGEVKHMLVDALRRRFEGPSRIYDELMADTSRIDAALAAGAERARVVAKATLGRVRKAVGIDG
jgi:tryptophanyl-tRNA synthetase